MSEGYRPGFYDYNLFTTKPHEYGFWGLVDHAAIGVIRIKSFFTILCIILIIIGIILSCIGISSSTSETKSETKSETDPEQNTEIKSETDPEQNTETYVDSYQKLHKNRLQKSLQKGLK